MLASRHIATLVAAALAILATPVVAQEQAERESYQHGNTVYLHVGRGSDGGDTTGGLGFLQIRSRFALGLDFGIEGKREDQTYGSKSIEDAYSINLLFGLPISQNETFQIVPFALLGARTYKTTCPTGQSYLGFRCYADYKPEQHWKINYGGGAVLNFNRMAVGVRVTGQSLAGIAGFNF